jgi:hippurate hydrolase
MALQTVVARNVNPTQIAVVTVGSIHGGKAMNVIANEVILGLSVRSFDAEVRKVLQTRITELATAQAASYGATAEIDYGLGHPVWSTLRETGFARQVAEELVGADNVADNIEQVPAARTSPTCCSSAPAVSCASATAWGENPAPAKYLGAPLFR